MRKSGASRAEIRCSRLVVGVEGGNCVILDAPPDGIPSVVLLRENGASATVSLGVDPDGVAFLRLADGTGHASGTITCGPDAAGFDFSLGGSALALAGGLARDLDGKCRLRAFLNGRLVLDEVVAATKARRQKGGAKPRG